MKTEDLFKLSNDRRIESFILGTPLVQHRPDTEGNPISGTKICVILNKSNDNKKKGIQL